MFEQPHVKTANRLEYNLGETKGPMVDYQVSIDELEARTGLDFFPRLKDNLESEIERTVFKKVWN